MKRTRWIVAPSLVASALIGAPLVRAQTAGEVVQSTPSAAAVDSLNRNLALLSRSPQDVNALLGAGQAALDLGDIQAANGFFTRANMVNPRLGKAKLGLAIVQIALKQPTEAAVNFDAAEALGEQPQGHLNDRGLAYDLTGQQEKAQRDYQAALRAKPSDELARLRYAVSLGISGKVPDANQQLEQALATGDREAWRMRAFIFAMNGRIADARKVTQAVMPKGLADALDPYMQRLPLLTTSQKAAAAYYGEFPTNVLKLAAPEPARDRPVQVAAATTERESSRNRRTRNNERTTRTAATTLAAAQPASAPVRAEPVPPPPQTDTPRPAAVTPPRAASTQLASNATSSPSRPAGAPASRRPAATTSTPASPPPVARPVVHQPQPQPSYEVPATTQLASGSVEPARSPSVQGPADPATTPPAAAAVPSIRPTPQPAAQAPTPGFSPSSQPIAAPRSLGDTLASLDIPELERKPTVVTADMAAVARIQEQRRKASEAAAVKAKADAEAKAKADAAKKVEAERKAKLAANPSRNWVQVATGKDVDALAFDLRRMRRTYAEAIGDLAGWTAEWGATRRLLVGPFKKPEDAKAVVTRITKSGGDAFIWQSEAGEEVAKIGGK